MIITKTISMKISVSNMAYWRSLGYVFDNPAPRWGRIPIIEVKVEHLQKMTMTRIDCQCERCEKNYNVRGRGNTTYCHSCCRYMYGFQQNNEEGSKNKGKKYPQFSGSNHPRWNPNKPALKEFTNRVHWLTHKVYESNKSIINPNNYPRTLCGVDGGYQLDHIVSIKEAFEQGWTPEQTSDLSNLQMLPWFENLAKSA